MSRPDHVLRVFRQLVAILPLVIVLNGAGAVPASGQETVIRIDTVSEQATGYRTEIAITLESVSPTVSFRYIYLVIGYEQMIPRFVESGQSGSDCIRYPYWNYVPTSECSGSYCPDGLLYIMALLEESATCFAETPVEICRVVFELQGDVGEFYPLRFFWLDCDHNSLMQLYYGADSGLLVISDQVYDFDGTEITLEQPLPTHYGAPESCVGLFNDSIPQRGMDLRNGGIGVSYVDSLNPPRAGVAIELAHSAPFGEVVDISIDLDPTQSEMGDPLSIGKFDFLLFYDTAVAAFLSAQPGQLLQDCGWEEFRYLTGTPGLIWIEAVADTGTGGSHPTCLADSIGQLAVLTFQTTADTSYECQYSPIYWYWTNCGDNTVATSPGDDTQSVSNHVFYPSVIASVHRNRDLPSWFGAPTPCILDSHDGVAQVRTVDFRIGGFDFICLGTIDQRGDLNLNDVPNEVADWVVYLNYFHYGPAVFQVDYQRQTEASDVNADGQFLTFWDFYYLYRVIVGDALPYPSPPGITVEDTVVLVQDTAARTISVANAVGTRAVMLQFDAEIETATEFPKHFVSRSYDSVYTRLIVSPDPAAIEHQDSLLLDTGILLTYAGDGNLVSASAASNGSLRLQATVQGAGSSACCVQRGNVDGIVGVGGPTDVIDLTMLVAYLFVVEGKPILPCPEEANIDDDCTFGCITVADLTFLAAYLFLSGTPPAECP